MKTPELFIIVDEEGKEHNVVGPPQGKDGLIAPIEDYFADPYLWGNGQYVHDNPPLTESTIDAIAQVFPPSNIPSRPIAEWFARNEQGRKDLVRNRAMEHCAVTGNPSREVHETFTRGAYGGAALVPWNMEVFYPPIHDSIQQHQMEILRADPLDNRKMDVKKGHGIFIIVGLDGKIIKQKDLWIYRRADLRIAEQDLIDVQKEILGVRKARWDIGKKLSRLKACEGYRAGGYSDIYEFAANYGISSPQAKMLIRTANFAAESGMEELFEAVDIEIADQLKKLPEEDIVTVFKLFANSSPAEAWDQYHKMYPPKKGKRRFRIMKREPYREVQADSIEDVEYGPDDMVITGGSVVIGITEDVDGK